MKSTWLRATLVSASLLGISGSGSQVYGNWFGGRSTVTTETVLALPSSYVVPTTYVAPTTYIEPTSYVATSRYVPTSYVYESSYYPTSYVSTSYYPTAYVYSSSYSPTAYVYPSSYYTPTVYATSYSVPGSVLTPSSYLVPTYYTTTTRRGLFSRRYVERAYLSPVRYYAPTTYTYTPTTYTYAPTSYYPTIYDYPVVATVASAASTCCGDTVASTATRVVPSAPAPTRRTAPAPAPSRTLDRAPSVLKSSPSSEEPGLQDEKAAPDTSNAVPPLGGGGTDILPPEKPAPEPAANGADTKLPAAPPKPAELGPPVAPGPGEVTPPAAPGAPADATRESKKPVYKPPIRVTRHILEGKVVNSDDNSAEEGVRVILTNRGGAFADRTTTTDAYGRYAVRVPDGDWTVKVTMPSGRVYAVSELTISGGEITDDLGRNVPSLTIMR